jgi:dihydroflavonol-4-reductase
VKIFITGSTGFIGTHLVRQLSQTDHKLYCLVRKTSDINLLNEIGATIIIGDVTDKDSFTKSMNDCDTVIHLASSFVFWVANKRTYRDVNVNGTRNVMESVLETGISKVISISTVGIYGNAKWPINEDSPYGNKRASRYCQTKYEGDLITWQLHKEKGLPLVMIHPSAVIGPNDPKAAGRYIKNYARGRMLAQVLTNTLFPWVHVKDVCESVIKALEKENNIGERYLVSNENLTFGEINNMISEISGKNLPRLKFPDWITMLNAYLLTGLAYLIRKPPIWDMSVDQIHLMKQGFEVDGSKAERELGFTYTPVRVGIEDAIVSFSR